MKMLLITSLLFSSLTYANQNQDIESLSFAEAKSELIEMIQSENLEDETSQSTCAADITKRLNQLKRRTFLAPVLGFGEVYAGMAVGAVIGVSLGTIVESSGWTGLVYGLVGAVVGGEVLLATYGVQQTVVISRLIQTNQLQKALLESTGEKEGNKFISKLIKKYLRHYPSDTAKLDETVLKNYLTESNEDGSLCNGSMVKASRRSSGKKLKQKIPLRRELFAHLHKTLN